MNQNIIPQSNVTKYLGMHLDRRLTWHTHIFTKRKQLGILQHKMNWLIGTNSSLSTDNKLLLYKAIIKPVWTYGIQLWGTASNTNIKIIQRYQNKALRVIVNAPSYVPNSIIQSDLQIPSIKEEIKKHCDSYKIRLSNHPNILAANLLTTTFEPRGLRRINMANLLT